MAPTSAPTAAPTPFDTNFQLGIDEQGTIYRCPRAGGDFCYQNDDPSRNSWEKCNRPEGVTFHDVEEFEHVIMGKGHWKVDRDGIIHWLGHDNTDYSFVITTRQL